METIDCDYFSCGLEMAGLMSSLQLASCSEVLVGTGAIKERRNAKA